MGEADVQLVAVAPGGGVAAGAGLGPHARAPEQPGQQIGGGDSRVERRPEAAPGGVEQEVPAHRALPGEHRLDPTGIGTDQHVAVQEIAVDQVPALRAGVRQCPHPPGDRRGKGGQLPVASQGAAPSVYQIPGIVGQASEKELPPAPGGRARLVPEHGGIRGRRDAEKGHEQAEEGGGDGTGQLHRGVLQEPPVVTHRDRIGLPGRGSAHLPDLRHRQVRAGEGHGHPVGLVPGRLRPEADHQLLAARPVGPRR
jgi:hypothetical protein